MDPKDEHFRDRAYLGSHGYVLLKVNARKRLLHRVITKAPIGKVVDHLNGDRLDCRRLNLKVTSQRENNKNIPLRKDNSSGYKGVFRRANGMWTAQIAKKHIGHYCTPEEANLARLQREKELWGILPRRMAAFQEAGLA